MNTAVVVKQSNAELMESVLVKGDLSKLNPQERTQYYLAVCESVGLNPVTKPFEYITLNGKLTLYALRNCTDQLRTIHSVSVLELTESEREGVFIVTAKVQNKEGRTDAAKGAVSIAGLKGEALANAMMKAETKAKRRATLSVCGLGLLDETEVETIPGARVETTPTRVSVAPAKASPVEVPHDPETGEIKPHAIPVLKNAEGYADWIKWGGQFVAAVKSAKTRQEWLRWCNDNQKTLELLRDEAPKVYERVVTNVDEQEGRFEAPKEAAE